MTAVPSIDPAQFLTELLSQASPDLMRDLLTTASDDTAVDFGDLDRQHLRAARTKVPGLRNLGSEVYATS